MPVTVRLTAAEELRLDNLVAQTGRTRSFYVKSALAEYLDDLEDLYLSEQSLARVNSGAEATFTLAEVRARLAVAG